MLEVFFFQLSREFCRLLFYHFNGLRSCWEKKYDSLHVINFFNMFFVIFRDFFLQNCRHDFCTDFFHVKIVIFDVEGRPELESSSMSSRPSWKRLSHLKTQAPNEHSLSDTSFNKLQVSVAVFPSFTWNFTTTVTIFLAKQKNNSECERRLGLYRFVYVFERYGFTLKNSLVI